MHSHEFTRVRGSWVCKDCGFKIIDDLLPQYLNEWARLKATIQDDRWRCTLPAECVDLLEAGRRVWRALSKVQWGASCDEEYEMCPACHALMEDGEHKPDCPVGAALAVGERWFGNKEEKC